MAKPQNDQDAQVSGKSTADLHQRIQERAATVAVVGLGYVGLPLLRALFDAGFPVVGFDVDPTKIERLLRGENYLPHLGADLARPFAGSTRFRATSDNSDLASADAIFICVPTPLGKHQEPDLSYVRRSCENLAKHLGAGSLVVLTSTTYPGTTRDLVAPIFEAHGLTPGRDVFLAFSPEREDPGREGFTTATIPRLVGGLDATATELASALLGAAVSEVRPVSSAEIAESAKLLENIYRAVNIALVNELKTVLTTMGIDIWEVIDAAATKPFGFEAFYPGPGLGGHCIPIDPFYLTWKAKELGLNTRFIELAGEVNTSMPGWVVERVAEALNEQGKPLKGSKVLVLGVAYKPNVADIRESPAAEIIERLLERHADVSYHDPHINIFPSMRHYDIALESIALSAEALAAQDCVLIVTDHRAIDWSLVAGHAPLVVDTRNALRHAGQVPAHPHYDA